MAGEESLAGLGLVVLVQLQLLQKQVGPCTHERVRFGGEDGFDMAEFLGQATQKVQHLAWFGDWMANVAQVVGEFLQLVAVVRDGHVPLDDAAELGLEENRALQLVVAEETFDVRPDGESGGVGLVNEVEDTLGDGCVDPVGDAAVYLLPFGVTVENGRRRTHMAKEAKLAKNRVKKTSPLAVVRLKEIKEDGDVIANVDGLQDGEGCRLRRVKEGIGGAGCRGGRSWRLRHEGAEEAEAERGSESRDGN
jgi:hypothetical protein